VGEPGGVILPGFVNKAVCVLRIPAALPRPFLPLNIPTIHLPILPVPQMRRKVRKWFGYSCITENEPKRNRVAF